MTRKQNAPKWDHKNSYKLAKIRRKMEIELLYYKNLEYILNILTWKLSK